MGSTITHPKRTGIFDKEPFDPLKKILLYDEFLLNRQNTYYTPHTSGTGAAVGLNTAVADNDHPGSMRHQTGSTNAGEAGLYASQSLYFGNGFDIKTSIYIANLSTGSEEYSLGFGLMTDVTAAPESYTNRIQLLYDRANLGANWHLVTCDDGTATETDTGIAVAAGSWVEVRLLMNDEYTLCNAYIGGALVAQNSTNFPDSGDVGYFQNSVAKSVGTTDRVIYFDYLYGQFSVDRVA